MKVLCLYINPVSYTHLDVYKRQAHATSHGKPETLKVSVGYKDCFIGEGEISYGGMNCMNRAKLAADIVEKRLKLVGVEMEEFRIDYIGYNSLYKSKISDQYAPCLLYTSKRVLLIILSPMCPQAKCAHGRPMALIQMG